MLALKDPDTGAIIARSIFKLLWDKEKNTPVLFFEQIYPEKLSKAQKDALEKLAIDKAQRLGLSLYCTASSANSEVQLSSLGCRAPYEYSDANATTTFGVYTINQAHCLYSPLQNASDKS